MSAQLRYDIVEMDLHRHEFHVRACLSELPQAGTRLSLPAWIPGSYMIRDFARNITAISAADDRGVVALHKLDKQTWQTDPISGDLILDYRVYAFDLSVRSAYLDDTRAFFNGTSLFLLPDGGEQSSWQLTIARPDAAKASEWQCMTTLPGSRVDAAGFGVYRGDAYTRLIDFPVEMGIQNVGVFDVEGVAHRVAASQAGRFDMERLCRDLAVICAEHAAMFGELPVENYLFLTLATADGYGGLEHLDSTSLICKRDDLPRLGLGKPDKGYRRFLGLCSHEYFHLWNVKRIRPAQLASDSLSSEVYTELLWAFEGITSYYDDLGLARSAVISVEDYLDTFATTVTRVMRGFGRTRQSIAESSFDAWTKFYKQDENAPNAIVSYYAKGALVAFGLDVTLRLRSAGGLCLDDLMRRLWQRYGKTAVGVPERAIETEVAELLGQSLDGFFEQFVYGTDELPLHDWFEALGIGFRLRPADGVDDNGGHRPEPPKIAVSPALGARFDAQPGGLCLTSVLEGGAAQRAGLSPGDVLLALDGEQLSAGNLGDLLQRAGGVPLDLHYFRRGRLSTAVLPCIDAVADTCDLWILPEPAITPEVAGRREAWLRSNRHSGGA